MKLGKHNVLLLTVFQTVVGKLHLGHTLPIVPGTHDTEIFDG